MLFQGCVSPKATSGNNRDPVVLLCVYSINLTLYKLNWIQIKGDMNSECSSVVKYLPNMYEALGSISNCENN